MKLEFQKDTKFSIRLVNKRRDLLSKKYIQERDKIWKEEMDKAEKKGKDFWEGEVYTIHDILHVAAQNVHIYMDTCSYKDIVFKNKLGVRRIVSQYGINCLAEHVSVDCIPITIEGKWVFGKRNDKTMIQKGMLALIGGTLNKDEMKVQTFNDIKRYAKKEIKEETQFRKGLSIIKLHGLYHYIGKYQFLFTIKTSIESSEVDNYNSNSEFSELIALSEEELRNYKGKKVPAFHFMNF